MFRVGKNGYLQFGMVVENSEFVSSDEDDEKPPAAAAAAAAEEENKDKKKKKRSSRKKRRDDSSSSEEDDDDDDLSKLKPGSVRVAWHPSGEEEVVQERNLRLADRSLMPGDVVRRFASDTQRGYCRYG